MRSAVRFLEGFNGIGVEGAATRGRGDAGAARMTGTVAAIEEGRRIAPSFAESRFESLDSPITCC